LEAIGLAASDYGPESFVKTVEVWPDNWPSVQLFAELGTQWAYGPAGPTKLPAHDVLATMELKGIPRSERQQLYRDIQVMEAEALTVMRERAARQSPQ
jgi:hypothetical protein